MTQPLPLKRRAVRLLLDEAQRAGLRVVRLQADLEAGTLDIHTTQEESGGNSLDMMTFEGETDG